MSLKFKLTAIVLVAILSLLAITTYAKPQTQSKPVKTASAAEPAETPKQEPQPAPEPIKVQELSAEAKKAIAQEEEMSNPKPKEEPKPQPQPKGKKPIEEGIFARGQTGQFLIDYVRGNPNGAKMYNAFEAKYGDRIAKKAAISLYYENGSLWELTTGVCSAKYQINGDYRNCNYADLNSAGFDAGLKQINTFYQSGGEASRNIPSRIAKLGGPTCKFQNKAESKNRDNECNQQLIAWLHNVDNNVTIALDIYADSGFGPWYGAQKAGVDNYS